MNHVGIRQNSPSVDEYIAVSDNYSIFGLKLFQNFQSSRAGFYRNLEWFGGGTNAANINAWNDSRSLCIRNIDLSTIAHFSRGFMTYPIVTNLDTARKASDYQPDTGTAVVKRGIDGGDMTVHPPAEFVQLYHGKAKNWAYNSFDSTTSAARGTAGKINAKDVNDVVYYSWLGDQKESQTPVRIVDVIDVPALTHANMTDAFSGSTMQFIPNKIDLSGKSWWRPNGKFYLSTVFNSPFAVTHAIAVSDNTLMYEYGAADTIAMCVGWSTDNRSLCISPVSLIKTLEMRLLRTSPRDNAQYSKYSRWPYADGLPETGFYVSAPFGTQGIPVVQSYIEQYPRNMKVYIYDLGEDG